MHVHRYLVVFARTNTGYSAHAPDVPGYVAAGETLEETEQLMREALEMHLEALAEDGLPIPMPATRGEYLEVKAGA